MENHMSIDLQYLLNDRAIRDVHVRYCRGIDRTDWDLVRSCFHPEAQQDYGDYKGGVDGLIDYAKRGSIFQFTMHFVGNQSVVIKDDTAWCESYTYAFHKTVKLGEAPPAFWNMNLRYIDRLTQREGRWAIIKRTMIMDSMTSGPAQLELPDFTKLFNKGIRGRADLSYVDEISRAE
jgi:hypothetical protein